MRNSLMYAVSAVALISLAVSSPARTAENQAKVKLAPVITTASVEPKWLDIERLPADLQAAFLAATGSSWQLDRVTFPAHYFGPPRSNPNAEAVWVEGGRVGVGFADKADMTGPLLKPGDFFARPGGTPQYVWTGDEGGVIDILTGRPEVIMFSDATDDPPVKNK